MPVIRPRASKAAVEEVYADLAQLIRFTAMRFVKRYHVDADEAVARANLHFLEAYHTFDPHRGRTIEQRVVYVVWMRLLDWVRGEAERAARVRREHDCAGDWASYVAADETGTNALTDGSDLDRRLGRRVVGTQLEAVPAAPDPTPSPTDPALDDLSPDAREVVRLTLFAPGAAAPAPRRVGPKDVRAAVRAYLRREYGWTKGRVSDAFTEIRGVLS